MNKIELTSNYLHEILAYNQTTGLFTWKINRSRLAKSGMLAGHLHRTKYIAICINGKSRLAHRLAWLYVYGVWPAGQIDHINGNRSDNRIINLRDVDNSKNQQNKRHAMSNNKTGFLGVHKNGSRFQAEITSNGVKVRLGSFNTPDEAHSVYLVAKNKMHPINS